MKVAVLGCGGLGRVHASIYAKMKDVELTGVCDLQLQLAHDLSEITGAPAYLSFEQMLEQAEFDVISIAVPSFLHKEYTIKAAKAGKHVICEKPIALHLEDAEEMIRCCEENGVRLFVGHVVRFFPDYVNMKRSLDEGKIGKACVAHASRIGSHPGDTKAWFKDFDQSGGVIVDLMIHDLDFLRWTLGEVTTVYGLNHCNDQLDYALVTLQFASGAVANVEANWGFPGPFQTKAEIAGNAGIVIANSLNSSSLKIQKAPSASAASAFVTIPESPGFQSPYELELQHFITSILTGSEAIVTARDAYKALELALAAIESVQTGKAVHLPLTK
ncbi:Gfo/Idh/MocA family oxidoreductase [Paenibacillus alba]|uniref:Gfo/Idh/MocA family protein n=1 Tax=Paenibacillus alba TaxID=1197127 RepID=UPI001564032D|nr:Gfo/Idh/MocA family oxidoreductase [Paenibacillus alba]NQX70440.1 Gfo/Idh/MocA family oxidoreductase [Paenibacillus alba]